MAEKVAVVGAGFTSLRALSPDVSFREMIFEAATRAYEDAGIAPRDIDSVVALGEDFREGTCISDEYVPDQLGAVQKPIQTVTGDGLQGLGVAVMLLQTGAFEVVVLEGHSKASNIRHPAHVEAMALDPGFVRPHKWHPNFVAGLEMRRFLEDSGNTAAQAARVAVKNRRNALCNPIAAYPANLSVEQVLASRPLAEPLRDLETAAPADGAFVFVIARESALKRLRGQPVFVDGIAWSSDTSNLFNRSWGEATYARQAAERAYASAGVGNPREDFNFAEVDDSFAYKELQHLEALGLAPKGQSGRLLEQGMFERGGKLPVNVSGGSLGCGHLHDASALRSLLEVVLQLRGHAGERQVAGARRGLVSSWRSIPTATGAVAVLSRR